MSHPTPEELRGFSRDALDHDRFKEVAEHIAACESCSRAYRWQKEVRKAEGEAPPEPSRTPKARKRDVAFHIVLPLLLIALGGGAFFVYFGVSRRGAARDEERLMKGELRFRILRVRAEAAGERELPALIEETRKLRHDYRDAGVPWMEELERFLAGLESRLSQ